MSQISKDINAFCTKCKMLLNHVVVSEIRGSVSKVQCRTCGSVHKYRGGDKKVTTEKRERTTRTARAKSSMDSQASAEIQARWQKKKDALPADPVIIDYRIGGDYRASDVVQHATFGLGFVERVLNKTRVEILFQAGLKVMVMNTGVSK